MNASTRQAPPTEIDVEFGPLLPGPLVLAMGLAAALHGALLVSAFALRGEDTRVTPVALERWVLATARIAKPKPPAPPPVVVPPPEPEPEARPKPKKRRKPKPKVAKKETPKPKAEPPKPKPAKRPPPEAAAQAQGGKAGAQTIGSKHASAVASSTPTGQHGGRGPVGGGARGKGPATAPPVDVVGLQRRYYQQLQRFMKRSYNYPRRARRGRIEGSVLIELLIDRQGRVLKRRVARSSGHAILDQAALESVRAIDKVPPPPSAIPWRRRPVRIPFHYRLK